MLTFGDVRAQTLTADGGTAEYIGKRKPKQEVRTQKTAEAFYHVSSGRAEVGGERYTTDEFLTADAGTATLFLPSHEPPRSGKAWAEKRSAVTIYPNPAGRRFTVALSEPGESFVLSDLRGTEVLRQKLDGPQTHVSRAGLPAGTYVYSVVAGGETVGLGRLVLE
jgi:hypothetical protein